jgi:predicted DNA-binding transcriptional regulator AlpA
MQSKVDERPVGPMSPKVIIDTNDRFIAIKELRTLVLYAKSSVRTLELKGRFPGRIQLSDKRVVWLEREVREWVEAQRKRGEAETSVRTYHVRLCRPRFEVATVAVEATNPSTAQNRARTLAKEGKSGWRILPYDPQIYRPHVETYAFEEAPTYSRDSVEAILSKYQDKYVRYLMLYADTNGGHGEVFIQPWLEDNKDASISHNLANNWISAIRRHVSTLPKSTRRKR